MMLMVASLTGIEIVFSHQKYHGNLQDAARLVRRAANSVVRLTYTE